MSVFSSMLSQAGSAYDTALTGYQNAASGFYGAGDSGGAPAGMASPALGGATGLGMPGSAQQLGLMSSLATPAAAAPAAATPAAPAAAAPATPAAGGITAAQGQMYQEEYRAYQAAQAGQTGLLAAFMRKYPNQRMPTI